MTEKEIDESSIMTIIHHEKFVGLSVTNFEGRKYWEITFRGHRKAGEFFYFLNDKKGVSEYFRFYKLVEKQ